MKQTILQVLACALMVSVPTQAAIRKEPCFCPQVYDPVCINGRQFSNACESNCGGLSTPCDGDDELPPVEPIIVKPPTKPSCEVACTNSIPPNCTCVQKEDCTCSLQEPKKVCQTACTWAWPKRNCRCIRKDDCICSSFSSPVRPTRGR